MNYKIAATACAMFMPGFALASDCGEVSITEMNWASASIVTEISTFLMTHGYGCDVTRVPSDTIPAVVSLSENGEPDIVTEMWTNGSGEAYHSMLESGKIKELTQVLSPGGVEGWWIPTYLAEAHPELTTIEGIVANPELVGNRFNNCPDGWRCGVVSENLTRALGVTDAGIEVFLHGSGETLAASLASAYEAGEPWFGYYWSPTKVMGKYDMTRVTLGDVDDEAHQRNGEAGRDNPEVSDFPLSPVLTVVTTAFEEKNPDVAELMTNISFTAQEMSKILAWQDENNASGEEAAVNFLINNKAVWASWLNDEAKANLAQILN